MLTPRIISVGLNSKDTELFDDIMKHYDKDKYPTASSVIRQLIREKHAQITPPPQEQSPS